MRINNINEALELLIDGNILTSDGNNQIILNNKMIRFHSENMNILLSLEDFKELYKNTTFYIYDEENGIDVDKDEDYYRYFKK